MAHNIVYYDTGTNSVIKMTTSDVDNLANYVLEYMYGLGTSATGAITSSSGGSVASIGTLTDYYRGAAGSSDITIYNTSYNFYQVQSQINTTNPPTVIGLDTSGSPTIVLQSNLMTLSDLADEIISRMNSGTYGGVNSYWFSVNPPSDGGTWVSAITNITDISSSGGGATQSFSLWRKSDTGTTATLTKRPLKLDGSNNLTSFTTTEVQRIAAAVEARMVSTGKGFYEVASTTPVTGTWIQAGDGFVDTVSTTTTGYFTGTQYYTGETPDGQYYVTDYFTRIFVNALSYLSIQPDAGSYLGTVNSYFIGNPLYQGINPDGNPFTLANSVNFAGGPTTYTGTGPQTYFAIGYTGTGNVQFGTSPIYIGPLTPTATYQGIAGFYTGPSTATAPYSGPPLFYTSIGPGIFGGYYTGASSTFFTGPGTNYLGPGPTYAGPLTVNFTGPGVAYTGTRYIGPGPVFFAQPVYYEGAATYLGPTPANFAGTGYYTGSTVSNYATEYATNLGYSVKYFWRRIA